MAAWRASCVVGAVVATVAACDKPDEAVALGWRPMATGQRIEIATHSTTTMLRVAGETHRHRIERFEILAVDGDRASRIRYDCSRDEHVVADKTLEPVVGTFDVTRSGNDVTVIKQGGDITDREKREVTARVAPMLDTMQQQRGLFTHRFMPGERYTPSPDEREGLGLGKNTRMTVALVAHDASHTVLGFDGEGRFEPAKNGYARGVLTGTFDASTDQRRLDVVTETDMLDDNGQKIGHAHYDSKQSRVD